MRKSEDKDRDLREIPKWTRRYAEIRAIPMIFGMLIFIALSVWIGGSSIIVGYALRDRNWVLLGFAVLLCLMSIIALVYFSTPKWGGKAIERMSAHFYEKDGYANIAPRNVTAGKKRAGYIAGIIFGSSVVLSVVLGMMGYIPTKYMQPVSAIYCVPFLIFLAIWQRPVNTLVGLLWAGLYALHAILIVAGVPVQFTGRLQGFNMLLPIAGYGLLSALVGHIYSRYALRKLKNCSGLDQNDEGQNHEAG